MFFLGKPLLSTLSANADLPIWVNRTSFISETIMSLSFPERCEMRQTASLQKQSKNKIVETSGNREHYTRQYAFGSMCEYSYCGHKLTRRTRHSSSIYEKPVWQCMNATKNGIKNCPHYKAIDEAILEGAFLEAFGLLAGNFDDVLDIVMSRRSC